MLNALERFAYSMTGGDVVVLIFCLVGIVIFGGWLIFSGAGFGLAGAGIRRNRVPLYMPFAQIVIWIVTLFLASKIASSYLHQLPEWKQGLVIYLVIAVIELVMVVVFLRLASGLFVRGLGGFGFRWRPIGRDLLFGLINFISVYPLVLLAIFLVVYLGRIFVGTDFQMEANEGLVLILQNPDLPSKVFLIVFIVIVAPVFEEVLFRGFLESVLRGLLKGPWQAVMVTSVVFALVHPYPSHWPALFILSMCMGYAYEKSGSLFRPVFIHAIFNAVSITAALLGGT